jgi:lipopolysaccharide export system protein LptA
MNELQMRAAQFYKKLGGPPIKIGAGLSVPSPSDTQTHHTSGFPLPSLADGTSKIVLPKKFIFPLSLSLVSSQSPLPWFVSPRVINLFISSQSLPFRGFYANMSGSGAESPAYRTGRRGGDSAKKKGSAKKIIATSPKSHVPMWLKKELFRLILIFLFILCAGSTFAQKKVKLKNATTAYGSMKDGERFDRLVGNVIFEQNTTTIYCDSAHFFRTKNMLDAFGHVHITEGDSVDITALGLSYDGNTKIAKLRKNVVFVKLGIARLYTDFLDYYRIKNEARYFNGGKLIDTTNTLTSWKGYYDIPVNVASFKTNVVGVNPDYTLTSDTLQYNSKTRVIYFRDTTLVKGKDGKNALYKNGTYNTVQKLSLLEKGEFETPSYKMRGDQNFLDDVKKFYTSKGNVSMTSKQEKMTIYGDDGFYDKKQGVSKVYGNAYVTKVDDEGDTLFLSADTLVSIEHVDPKKKRLLAYNHVKIFKTNMQGSADSLAYVSSDSTLYLYTNPILWSEENQMTADSIRVLLKNKKINRIYMVANSFVISQDSMQNFNQIKGRKMTAYFDGKDISHVIVQGNGESLYYALEEKEVIKTDSLIVKLMITMGMNKMICSNMRINFAKGKVNNVSFYIKPDAQLIPIHELKKEDRTLKGFIWRRKERPLKSQVERKSKERGG